MSTNLTSFDSLELAPSHQWDILDPWISSAVPQTRLSIQSQISDESSSSTSSSIADLSPTSRSSSCNDFFHAHLGGSFTPTSFDWSGAYEIPTTSNPLVPIQQTARKDSIRKDMRAERRRAQNRTAQRAYRARKDTLIKEYTERTEALETELAGTKHMNDTLQKESKKLKAKLHELEATIELLKQPQV